MKISWFGFKGFFETPVFQLSYLRKPWGVAVWVGSLRIAAGHFARKGWYEN